MGLVDSVEDYVDSLKLSVVMYQVGQPDEDIWGNDEVGDEYYDEYKEAAKELRKKLGDAAGDLDKENELLRRYIKKFKQIDKKYLDKIGKVKRHKDKMRLQKEVA